MAEAVLGGYANSYQRLIDMGPEKLAILEGRMAMAEPTPLLVKVIQQEWKLCEDVPPHVLRRQVARYRSKFVTPKMALLYSAAKNDDKQAEKNKAILYEQLDMMEELTDLYQLQRQRIHKGVLKERDEKTLDKALGFEIEVTRKIVADMLNLQFELGMLRRAPKTKTGFVQNSDGSQTAFQVTEEDGRQDRLRDHMQKFLEFVDAEIADEESLPANPAAIGVDSSGNQSQSQ